MIPFDMGVCVQMSQVRDLQDEFTRTLIAAQLSVLEWVEEDCGMVGKSPALDALEQCLVQAGKLLKKARRVDRP